MINQEKQRHRLLKILDDCFLKKVWGKVTLQVVDGNLVEVQVTQTLKLDAEEEVVCVKQKVS